MAKVIGKGKALVGKMNAILTDSHLDSRMKRCNTVNVLAPKLECARGNAKFVKRVGTARMTAAVKVLGCTRRQAGCDPINGRLAP